MTSKYILTVFTLLFVISSLWEREGRRVVSFSHQEDKLARILHRDAKKMSAEDQFRLIVSVKQLAKEYHLDPLLIMAVMYVESRFQANVVSHKGAMGLMQVKPIVVKEVSKQMLLSHRPSRELTNPEYNVHVGTHYLASLLKRFRGDVKKALMAYNAGPTTVSRIYGNRSVPPTGYQGRVLKVYSDYSQF